MPQDNLPMHTSSKMDVELFDEIFAVYQHCWKFLESYTLYQSLINPPYLWGCEDE